MKKVLHIEVTRPKQNGFRAGQRPKQNGFRAGQRHKGHFHWTALSYYKL
jgi:hypothetical protein